MIKILLNFKLKTEFVRVLDRHQGKIDPLNMYYTGYREFYVDGSSLSISKNANYYNMVKNWIANTDNSIGYIEDLAKLESQKLHLVFCKALPATAGFINQLVPWKRSNSILIYQKTHNKIIQYIFSTSAIDLKELSLLVNKSKEFEGLISSFRDDVAKIFAQTKYSTLRRPLFSERVAKKLFYILGLPKAKHPVIV